MNQYRMTEKPIYKVVSKKGVEFLKQDGNFYILVPEAEVRNIEISYKIFRFDHANTVDVG